MDLQLPDVVARCVAPSAPEALRLLAARGGIPLPPGERLSALTMLLEDPAPAVRGEAEKAWAELPATFLGQALTDSRLPAPVLDRIAARAQEDELLHRVLEHPSLGADTLSRYVDSEDDAILSRLAQNQRLLSAHPELLARLLANPRLPAEERARLLSHCESEEEENELPSVPSGELPSDLPAELLEDMPGEQGVEGKNLYQLVQSLSVAEKIKLATLGSKSARRLLVRDTNRIVQTAVIRSPKIGEDEVLAVAQDRTAPEEVIRIVLSRKDWLKNYPIRLALCQNPKTPIPRSVRLLETLQEKDLRQLSKSRNVPSAVSSGALRILARRGRI